MSVQNTRSLSAPTVRAFTLVEMLAVMAIVTLILSFTVPALDGLVSVRGRKGAVNILMNAAEQARVSALESSSDVYIGFAGSEFPEKDFSFTRFILFRKTTDQLDGNSTARFVPLGKWTRLPEGISVGSKNPSITYNGGNTGGEVTIEPADNFPMITATTVLKTIKFNSTGMIETPSTSFLKLYIYEGYFFEGQDNYTKRKAAQNSSGALFEIVSFSRMTGRASYDTAAL